MDLDQRRSALEALAPLLYGPRWGRELARVLEVDDRLVRRWRSGERPIPEWAALRLLEIADERGAALQEAAAEARELMGRSTT